MNTRADGVLELNRLALEANCALRWTVPIQPRQILRAIIERCLFPHTRFALVAAGGSYLLIQGWEDADAFGLPPAANALFFVAASGILWLGALLLYQILYYFTYHYDVANGNVIIRKGVICRKEITLPLSRITDVYLDQDRLGWIFGLYDVHISTPTVQSARFAHMVGVDRSGAHSLRAIILDHMNRENEPQDDDLRGVEEFSR